MALGHGAARPAGHSPAAAGAQGQQGQRPREHRRGPVSTWEVLPPHPAAARPASSFSHPAAILRDGPVLQRRAGKPVRTAAGIQTRSSRKLWNACWDADRGKAALQGEPRIRHGLVMPQEFMGLGVLG